MVIFVLMVVLSRSEVCGRSSKVSDAGCETLAEFPRPGSCLAASNDFNLRTVHSSMANQCMYWMSSIATFIHKLCKNEITGRDEHGRFAHRRTETALQSNTKLIEDDAVEWLTSQPEILPLGFREKL